MPKTHITLVGNTESGKTRLLSALLGTHEDYDVRFYYTIVAVHNTLVKTLPDGKEKHYTICDTGGVLRFRSLMTTYLRDASTGYIFLDLNKEIPALTAELDEWIELLHTYHVFDEKIVLVGTKRSKSDPEQPEKIEALQSLARARNICKKIYLTHAWDINSTNREDEKNAFLTMTALDHLPRNTPEYYQAAKEIVELEVRLESMNLEERGLYFSSLSQSALLSCVWSVLRMQGNDYLDALSCKQIEAYMQPLSLDTIRRFSRGLSQEKIRTVFDEISNEALQSIQLTADDLTNISPYMHAARFKFCANQFFTDQSHRNLIDALHTKNSIIQLVVFDCLVERSKNRLLDPSDLQMFLEKLGGLCGFDYGLLKVKYNDIYRCIIDQLLESPSSTETDLFRHINSSHVLTYLRPLSEHITQFKQIITRISKNKLSSTLARLSQEEVRAYFDTSSNEELDSRLSLVLPALDRSYHFIDCIPNEELDSRPSLVLPALDRSYHFIDCIPLERVLTYIKPLTKDMRRFNQIFSASSDIRVRQLFENISDNELLAMVRSVDDLNALALSIHSYGVNRFLQKFPFKEWINALDNQKTSRGGLFKTQEKMPAIKFNEQVLKNITHDQATFVLKRIQIEDAELGLLDEHQISMYKDVEKVRSAFTNHQLIYLSAYYAEKTHESNSARYKSKIDQLIHTIQQRIKKGDFLLTDYEELFAQNQRHDFLTPEIQTSIQSAQQALQMHGTQSCCLVM